MSRPWSWLCLLLIGALMAAHPTPTPAAEIAVSATAAATAPRAPGDDQVRISGPMVDAVRGVQRFTVRSPYLNGANAVEVLLPDHLEAGRTYPVLYILPVEGGIGGKFGDGLMAVKRADAHNRHGLICVTMGFDSVPWFGSHATDPRIRHDEYLLKVVLPLVESRFPASPLAKDRLLFGFSKSGYGAVTLLLRHLDVFGGACAWDAPLMFAAKDVGKVGTGVHFGTAEQMAKYLPRELAAQQAATLAGGPPRLTILGKSLWARPTADFAKLLTTLKIPHRYDDTLVFEHRWDSGWVPKALEEFLAPVDVAPAAPAPAPAPLAPAP